MLKSISIIGIVGILVGLFFTVSLVTAESTQPDETADHRFVTEDVHFKPGSYAISQEAAEILNRKAAWLKANPSAVVIIEGHTDFRNGREANLAFGEWRAGAVKSYLMKMGIDGGRLNAVSYGEEVPVDPGKNAAARAKNRRVHFVIESR